MTASAAVGQGWLMAAGCCGILIGVILLTGWPMTALWVTGLLALASKTRTSQEAPAAG
jgi:uncharacterized membrane protein HdeD (DUF308 family)